MHTKSSLRVTSVFAVLFALGFASTTTAVPATATFSSSIAAPTADCVYADLGGSYQDGQYIDAANATVNGASRVSSNEYFLRTVGPNGTTATNIRGAYLDFKNVVTTPSSSAMVDPNDSSGAVLYLGGVNPQTGQPQTRNFIPDLRIIASDMFAKNATSTGTSVIMPFSLQPEFTGSSDFELDYETKLTVTAPTANTRVLTAGPSAIADLYVVKSGKKSLVGRFYLPFTLTVTTN